MIEERRLEAALRRAGGALPLPANGPASILRRARDEGLAPLEDDGVEPPRFGHRRLILAATAAVIVVGLSIAIPLATSSTTPTATASGLTPLPGHSSASASAGVPAASDAGGSIGAEQRAAVGGPVAPAGSSAAPAGPRTPALIASSGTLTLRVGAGSVAQDAHDLAVLAERAGGYVASASLLSAASPPSGSVVVEIPAKAFTSAISAAERLGTLRSLATSNADETTTSSNLVGELQALDDVRAQLEVLLGRTAKVSDLLAVENQIQAVETQIDQLQAAQRALGSEITYARLTVDLDTSQPSRTEVSRHGFALAWHDATTGFLGGVRYLVSISGDVVFALLLLVAAVAILALILRELLPRLRRRLL